MRTKPAFKVGLVRITERSTPKCGRSYFELRYRDRSTGLEVRRRVSGLSRDEVREMADNLNRQNYEGKGYLAKRRSIPTVEEGFVESIALTHTRDETRRERARTARAFVQWLAAKYPAAKTWAELQPKMILAYKIELERRGLARDTVRLNLEPIRLAWRRMSEDYPNLIRPLARIEIKAARKSGVECLESGEAAALLDWMKINLPGLWPMAVLQATCGLRMLEACHAREQDVDFERGTVTVAATALHVPKTDRSHRTIPVCREALEALRSAAGSQKVRPATGELFVRPMGGCWNVEALSRAFRAALRRAAVEIGNPRLAAIPARKLRASFATTASRLGAPDRALKAYLGHSSGDVLGEHYRRIDQTDLKTVSDAMEDWRRLADESRIRKESGNIPTVGFVEG